ncbi:FGGY family carbohydrate kinase [Georgenia sp. TF02-10]|uniref:FGGY-family carbohydrate kinase n=1 Tax=Georgenia sp. TF02-10 TaxID=2917725 RepID=UPI001FA712BB|nr:FGGY family carbohydrate kinase [Georgenia sp. TF02-10]UNX56265.1 FGGY family carbohydrate kinase [Georgenia sp. TF02-10]
MRSLGLDVGSTNLKAVLVDVDATPVHPGPAAPAPAGNGSAGTGPVEPGPAEPGPARPVTVASAAVPTPGAGAALVAAAVGLVRDVLARSDVPPACVGVAGMAETGVPLDGADRPLGDLVRWDPHRASAEAAALAGRLGAAELFTATGVRPSGKVPLATWAHLRAHDPGRWSAMHRWAGAADLLVLALTGRLATDHTLAGRTMAYRLPGPGDPFPPGFDPDLLAEVGLRPDQLPAVAVPTETAGRVRPEAAAATGLRAGTPVVVAGHDHAVGAWAAGVRTPGDVADSLGTAEAVVRVLGARPEPAAVAAAGMSLVRTVTGCHDALVAGSPSAGEMVRWFAERYADGQPVPELLARAAARPGPRTGLFVLPYLRGRQTPAPDPGARARVLGRRPHHDLVDLAGALLEGLSLHARWMHTEQARLAGADPATDDVVVLGSAAAPGSPLLQVKAAVGPTRLRSVADPEPVAAGAALLAAHRSGLTAEPAPLATSATGRVPEPAYDEHFRRFRRAATRGEP